MKKQIDNILKTRQVLLNVLEGLTIEQLNKVPDGFNNNLVWNLAHLVVTPQILCYKFSDLPFTINEDWLPQYAKGTKPERFVDTEECETIKAAFINSINGLMEDYENGKFQTYKHYINSFGIEHTCVEDAIRFSAIHDGLHLGYSMALKHLV